MTTAPAKHQQPLHNFSLPFLKWGQRAQSPNHCRRRYRNYPLTDSDLDNCRKPHRSHNRLSKDIKTKVDEDDDGVLLERGDKTGKSISDAAAAAAADGDVKPWNLRPRRFVINTGDANGAFVGVSSAKSGWLLRGVASSSVDEEKMKMKEKEEEDQMKKKRRLWISLSKEEIEEDVYTFTGSRPARRPKKRNRIAQKQVDNVFPGLYLVGISADSYRV